MEEQSFACSKMERCPFTKPFSKELVDIANSWIRMFCSNKVKSNYCARKQYFELKGEAPSDNLTPLGTLMFVNAYADATHKGA